MMFKEGDIVTPAHEYSRLELALVGLTPGNRYIVSESFEDPASPEGSGFRVRVLNDRSEERVYDQKMFCIV